MQIGPHLLPNQLILAPMAGITDHPFRRLCLRMGAAMAVSEMVSSKPSLQKNHRTSLRFRNCAEAGPWVVQILGNDPAQMAQAAQHHEALGAQMIDINMGCPAKKVCRKAAGSALMQNEGLVRAILEAVVNAVTIPVSLKIRTGWDQDHRNGPAIAQLAQDYGICSLAVHGRTRADAFRGQAEYDTIRAIKADISIPVIANGDIQTPEQAKAVLDHTGADGLMLGRAAQGRPWIFAEIAHYLKSGKKRAQPTLQEVLSILLEHLQSLYDYYGTTMGVRIARKHIGWYLQNQPAYQSGRSLINQAQTPAQQMTRLQAQFPDYPFSLTV